MAKLSDKQKKEIVAMFVETQNKSAVARKFGVSVTTVANIINAETETLEKLEVKKRENVSSILSHMDARKTDVCTLIDTLLDEMKKPEKVAATSMRELATTMGILIDKFTLDEQNKKKEDILAASGAVVIINDIPKS